MMKRTIAVPRERARIWCSVVLSWGRAAWKAAGRISEPVATNIKEDIACATTSLKDCSEYLHPPITKQHPRTYCQSSFGKEVGIRVTSWIR